MRILAEITSWNAADVIGGALDAIRAQSLRPESVLIVDNASTDGTAEFAYPENVTLLKQSLNLGPGGAIGAALEYARARDFDWLWVLDADSRPRHDTLELLAQLAELTIADGRGEVGAVGPSHNLLGLGKMSYGRKLTPGGPRATRLSPNCDHLECDAIIWSGALINISAATMVGVPRAGAHGVWEDLSIDYGDLEYSYRLRRAGYRVLVHCKSIVDHRVGNGRNICILGLNFYSTNHNAFRRYLYLRNLAFFWLRLYDRRNWVMLMVWFTYRLSTILAGILIFEHSRRTKLWACMVGLRDGVSGRLDRRFLD